MANARQGSHSTRSRSEIRATGAKWYRQKGSGRARHGAQSAPIFVGGGLAHGPKPRDYSKKMPKKMRRGAIRSTLSALVRDDQLVLVDKLDIDAPKTRAMRKLIETLGWRAIGAVGGYAGAKGGAQECEQSPPMRIRSPLTPSTFATCSSTTG